MPDIIPHAGTTGVAAQEAVTASRRRLSKKKEFFFSGTNLQDCVESKGDSGFGFRNKPTVCGQNRVTNG
jgi:hypothetical protein